MKVKEASERAKACEKFRYKKARDCIEHGV